MIQDYEVMQVLGTGSYGTVSKVRSKKDSKVMVWKEINFGKMSEKEKTQLVAEVNILRDLKNPFIVEYHDRILDRPNTKLYIIMEHCSGGDLAQLIKKCVRNNSNLDEPLIWKILAQCLMALKDCHRRQDGGRCQPIIHRDIKPANILLDAKQNIKMGDFGLAKELSSRSKLAQTNVGTPYYMAPEIINEKDYDEKSDIWSLGCLLYELAALAPPFNASNAVSLAVKINAGRYPQIPKKYSDSLQSAIRSMIQVNPRLRPRVEDLETLPALQSALLHARHVVHEYKFDQNCATQKDSLRAREEAVVARETQLKLFENSLRERETKLQQWEEKLKNSAAVSAAAQNAHKSHEHISHHHHHHQPQHRTGKSRLSMDRVTESMTVDDEEDAHIPAPPVSVTSTVSITRPPTPPRPASADARMGPVPVPASAALDVRPVTADNARNQPTFEIYCDKVSPKALNVVMRAAPPVPQTSSIFAKPAHHTFQAMGPPQNAPVSTFIRMQRNGPIVTGSEREKENVYNFGTAAPSSSAVPIVAPTAVRPSATQQPSTIPTIAPANGHNLRRPMELDAATEREVCSPMKKQRGPSIQLVQPGNENRKPLQPRSHQFSNVNQLAGAPPSRFDANKLGAVVGAGAILNRGGVYPTSVKVDLQTFMRQPANNIAHL